MPGAVPSVRYSPFGTLADWGTRAVGFLIDTGLVFAVFIVAAILVRISPFLGVIGYLAAVAASFYLAFQVGQTGQSPGMRVMGIKCINMQTGQLIGGGLGIVRSIAHFVDDIICYVGWFFPLWDTSRQTLADKIMKTVVIVVPKQGFSLTPPTP